MSRFQITDNTRLIDLFGPPEYNNLNEPLPFTNTRSCLIGFTVTFLALSWIFVCLRLVVRMRVVRMPGLDDLFVFLYLVFTTIASIVFLLTIKYGTGRHFLLLSIGNVTDYLKLFYVMNINFNFATTFIKLSLFFQFLRLFKKGTWAFNASIIGIVLVSMWGTAFILLSLFPCSYIPDAWNVLSRDAHCWGYASQDADAFTATLVSHNLINTLFDIYLTIIPFQLYFQEEVAQKTRFGLLILLLMGGTVVTLSAWRVNETIYYKGGWYPTHDPTWYGPKSILLMVLEINVASICASVPIFWPVIRPLLGAIFVTREVIVKHEVRDEENDSRSSSRGQEGSEGDLNDHYKDSFLQGLVNPFGGHAGGHEQPTTTTQISGEKTGGSWLKD